jgi:hypothetical protein
MTQPLTRRTRRWRREQRTHRVRAAALLVLTTALAGVLIGLAAAAVVALVVTWAQGFNA